MSKTPEDLLKSYEAALNSHDEVRLDDLVAPDAVFIFTDGTFTGIGEIKNACRKTWAHFQNEIYRICDLIWLDRTAESASCIYRIEWEADCDAQRQTFRGRGTTLMKNYGGVWKVSHEHLSREPDVE